MRRPTREERRRDLLRSGAEVAARAPGPDAEVRAPAHVTVEGAAERAGVVRGAVYHHWSSQEAYRMDVVASLADARPADADGPEEPAHPPNLDEAVGAAVRTTVRDPAVRVRWSLLPYTANDTARRLLADGDRALVDGLVHAALRELDAAGRRLRPGFTDEHLRSVVAGLVQGLGLIGVAQADEHDDRLDALVGSAGITLRSVLDHFSEPTR